MLINNVIMREKPPCEYHAGIEIYLCYCTDGEMCVIYAYRMDNN